MNGRHMKQFSTILITQKHNPEGKRMAPLNSYQRFPKLFHGYVRIMKTDCLGFQSNDVSRMRESERLADRESERA